MQRKQINIKERLNKHENQYMESIQKISIEINMMPRLFCIALLQKP